MVAVNAAKSTLKNEQKAGISQVLQKSHNEQLKAFEKMLITRLKHPADPLNPKGEDFTQTLMMFHSTAQQSKMNENLEQINLNHIKAQTIAAKSYLNKEVEYQGSEFTFEGEEENLMFRMPDNAVQAQLTITDMAGARVTAFPVALEAGAKSFVWNGSINGQQDIKAPNGQYQAKVIVETTGGETLEMPMTFKGTVRKIGFHEEAKEFALLIKNTPVELSSVTSVSKAPASQLTSITNGIQEQSRKYDELSEYLKDKFDNPLPFPEVKESIGHTGEQLVKEQQLELKDL